METNGLCCRSRKDKTSSLTSHVEELREGLHRHELLLEGLQGSVGSFADRHVVVADVLRERAGPASLGVAGGHLLQEPAGAGPGAEGNEEGSSAPKERKASPPLPSSAAFPLQDVFCSKNNEISPGSSLALCYTPCHSNLQATSGCILSSLHVTPAFPKEEGIVKMP